MLHTIQFSKLNLWDVKRYNFTIKDNFDDGVLLNKVLKPYKVAITKEQLLENEWKIISKINFSGELFLRETEDINSYKGSLNIVPENSIIYSKINVRHGCIYYHPLESIPFGVSSEYPVFTFDKSRVNGSYLMKVLRSNEFKKLLNTKASGISKARVKASEFLGIRIPLPPIEKQDSIAASHDSKINEAEELLQRANALEIEIDKFLSISLGIKVSSNLQNSKGLKFTSFKELSRWDTLFLISHLPSLSSSFPLEKFSNAIKKFNKDTSGKSLRINSFKYPDKDFHYIGMEHIEKKTGKLIEINKVKGAEIKSQTIKIPKGYFIFGKLRPYLKKYWLNDSDLDDIICSSEFFVFNVGNNVNEQYFKYILSSDFIQLQINDKTSGARMPRINEEIFLNLQFPLPPVEVQTEIAQKITGMKLQIDRLKESSLNLRKEALIEFEKEIFKN